MKTKIISIALIITLLMGCCLEVLATSKKELTNQSSEIDSKISETEDEVSEVNSELSGAMKEVQTLITQISEYEQSIDNLNSQITEKETQISEKEQEIDQTQKTLDEKQDLLDKRLVALYESGQTSYIELLLSSADLTDFISKYYLISELATYDTELIETIRNAKVELETAKSELESSKTELENSKTELETQKNALASAKAEKDKKVASLTAEEKALEAELSELEAEKKELQNKLAAIAKQEEEERARAAAAAAAAANTSSSGGSSSSSGTSATTVSSPSAAGYIFPVSGCSKSNIRNLNYPSYSGHTGVDVNIGVTGKSVVAVKSGTVVISEAKKRNGSYYSYGEYVVINHHDGTMTLYAHMLAGSRTVSVGQSVSQGQVIGTVGSTGNSTGTHLHFEVRVGGKPVNPIPYLP